MAKSTIAPQPSSTQEKFLFSRKLKVREGYYDHQHRRRSGPYKAPTPVPWVQMKGYWLEEAGFTIGTAINVEVCKGMIALIVVPNPSD